MDNLEKIVTIIGVIAAAFGIFLQWWENRKNHRLQFFSEYTRRFQEIMISMPEIAFNDDFDSNKIRQSDLEDLKKPMRAYFALCSEEFDLKNENYIKKRIWIIWSNGIKQNLQKPAFRWGWDQAKSSFLFFPEFVQWMEESVITK